jgi:hypothetical protein
MNIIVCTQTIITSKINMFPSSVRKILLKYFYLGRKTVINTFITPLSLTTANKLKIQNPNEKFEVSLVILI